MFNEIQEMINGLNEMVGVIANHPDLCNNIAKVNAKLRDAHIAQGFSREEAIEIVKSTSLIKSK